MMFQCTRLLGLLSLSIITHVAIGLRIGAFNIKVFGRSKMGKPEVVSVLVDILSRYDIVLVQEIRDNSGEVITELVAYLAASGNKFQFAVSSRLGRTSSKEQYAFLYRPEMGISLMDEYVFDDGNETLNTANVSMDLFEREPYVVMFKSTKTRLATFVLAGIHVSPSKAVEEINHLADVFADIRRKWTINDIMVLGDLNAGCSYVSQKDWDRIPLKHDPAYAWLTPDDTDTTVGGTHCAYDRFVMTGYNFRREYLNDSAIAFRFDDAYGLNHTFALEVSDHYPIELQLKDRVTSSGLTIVTLPSGYDIIFLMFSYTRMYMEI